MKFEQLTQQTCLKLLDEYGTKQHIIAHCKAVADVAMRITGQLNSCGLELDINAIHAAALLHDIARSEKEHAKAGAAWLSNRGYPSIAELVVEHMQLGEGEDEQINEKMVVYIADKLVNEAREISIYERFFERMAQCGPDALQAIMRRYIQALGVYLLITSTIRVGGKHIEEAV